MLMPVLPSRVTLGCPFCGPPFLSLSPLACKMGLTGRRHSDRPRLSGVCLCDRGLGPPYSTMVQGAGAARGQLRVQSRGLCPTPL